MTDEGFNVFDEFYTMKKTTETVLNSLNRDKILERLESYYDEVQT